MSEAMPERAWTPEEESELLHLKDTEGLPWKEIAKRLGRSKEGARSKYRHLVGTVRKPGDTIKETVTRESLGKNEMAITSDNSGRIKTLGDLIRVGKIDEDIWHIYKYLENKWEVGAKHQDTHLEYIEGKADGYVDKRPGLVVEPLFQVKAWMIRHNLEAVFPMIQPINIGATLPRKKTKATKKVKSMLVIPDTQIGYRRDMNTGKLTTFHDRKAMSIVFQLLKDYKFDRIVKLGDLIDNTEWTDKFLKESEFFFTSQPAIIESGWFLRQLRLLAPEAEIYFCKGNHEDRMRKMMLTHLRAACDIRAYDELHLPPALSIERLLALEKSDINYVDHMWVNDTIKVSHGEIARANPGATVQAVVGKAYQTHVFGHTHKIELATKTIRGHDWTKYVTSFSPGCLCKIDGEVPGSKHDNQWQQGIGVLCYTDEEVLTTIAVQINDGKAIYNGILYEGEDYKKQLSQDTGWSF